MNTNTCLNVRIRLLKSDLIMSQIHHALEPLILSLFPLVISYDCYRGHTV